MRTILDVLPLEQANDPEQQSIRVATAYAAVFSGAGTLEDAELVLVDMAIFVRYYDTALPSVPAEEVKALDQRRAVFQRVLEAMTRAGHEPHGLHSAVLRSPPIDTVEET